MRHAPYSKGWRGHETCTQMPVLQQRHAKCHKRSPDSQESQKEKEFNFTNQKDAT